MAKLSALLRVSGLNDEAWSSVLVEKIQMVLKFVPCRKGNFATVPPVGSGRETRDAGAAGLFNRRLERLRMAAEASRDANDIDFFRGDSIAHSIACG